MTTKLPFRGAIIKGQILRCRSIETGVLDGVKYWAFDDVEANAYYEIFCKIANAPADLKAGDLVDGAVECIRAPEGDGRPGVFLSRVVHTGIK